MRNTQIFIEQQYSKEYVNKLLKEWLYEKEIDTNRWETIYLEWLEREYEWEPKNERTSKWAAKLKKDSSATDFIVSVFAYIFAAPKGIQLQAVMSAAMHLVTSTEDEVDQLTTVGELLNLLQYEDIYSTEKIGMKGYRYLIPTLKIPKDIALLIDNCQYLPPMVMEPGKVTENRVNWATRSKSVFLKKHHHEEEIDTEFLDIMNSTPMALDYHMLKYRDEDTEDRLELSRAEAITELLLGFSKFYFIYRYDARLRSYASGYQLNPMGTDYKKSQLNLFKKELCTDEIL